MIIQWLIVTACDGDKAQSISGRIARRLLTASVMRFIIYTKFTF